MKLFHSYQATKPFSGTDEAISSNQEAIPKQTLDTIVLDQTRRSGGGCHEEASSDYRIYVAVILLAAAATATATTMRSPAPSTQIAPTGSLVLNELAVDVNKLPIEDFEDMSLVFSKH